MGTDKEPKVILVVDDERNVLNAVRRSLRKLDVYIETTDDATEALGVVRSMPDRIAAVVADQRMPGLTGLEFLRKVKDIHPNIVRVLFTGFADMDVVIRAINEGQVFRFIQKPWQDIELQGLVLTALQHHEILVQNERLLATVREQRDTLEELERLNPGLTKLPPRDESGAFILDSSEFEA
jgi:FixJ family two-component response regulator